METLWSALGICAIVGFVFYVLAAHWQRLLRHQFWTIRRLTDRVQILEELADPAFRQRLGDSIPVPLGQVFTFSFHLSDRFWREKLYIADQNWKFIRGGSFVASAKLEKWRSHTVATITEVLPESKSARWKTRSLDFYPDAAKAHDFIVLWELALAPINGSGQRPPVLQLVLLRSALELRGHLLTDGTKNSQEGRNRFADEDIFLHVPLDSELLAEFRRQDPTVEDVEETPGTSVKTVVPTANSWHSFYSNRDENVGIEWNLRMYDLQVKAEWERWKILEPAQPSPIQR
jgi:hypothetical protein